MIIAVLTSSMLITVLLIPALIKFARPLKLIDLPNERKIHLNAIPRVGGIAIVLGVLVPLLILMPEDKSNYGILLGFAIIFLFGILDDRGDLNYKIKFTGQILAALVVVVIGDVSIRWLPFTNTGPIPDFISLPLTIFCLLAVTNAIAISDGLDGLTGGSSLLSFTVLGILAFVVDDTLSMIIIISVIGSILGFLRYNAHPAIIFMGDTGSQFLGFSVGTVAILLTQHSYIAINPLFPVLLLGLPIIDTVWVMISRLIAGDSPFKADKKHIHHRLLSFGLTHFEVVVLIYLIHIVFALSAFYFRFADEIYLLLAFITITSVVISSLLILDKIAWQRKQLVDVSREPNFTVFSNKIFMPIEKLFSLNIVFLLLPLLFFCSLLDLNGLETDLFALCMFLLLVSIIAIIVPNKKYLQLNRVTMYIFSALISYLSYEKGYSVNFIVYLDFVYLTLLSMLLFMYILSLYRRNDENKLFTINPTDILISLLVLILPLLSLFYHKDLLLTVALVKFIIFLYLFEIILVERKYIHSLNIFFISMMCIICFKALPV